MDFQDKVCIVTGGSRGIGKSITEALLKKGAKVLFVDVLYKLSPERFHHKKTSSLIIIVL